MNEITDELLMAYADGELDSAEQRRVELYLAAEPAAVKRLAMFAKTGRDLGLLFDQPMREAIPERLLQTVLGPSGSVAGGTMKSAASRLPDILTALIGTVLPTRAGWQPAFAVVALVAVGAAAGWSLNNSRDGAASSAIATLTDGALVANKAFASVLDAMPSGTEAKVEKQTIKPLLSFQNVAGGYCRQYELSNTSGSRFSGVGCRAENGAWRIEVHTQVGNAPGNSPQPAIAPASGPLSPIVESVVDRMIKGDALGVSAERALIDSKWRSAP
jgi:anti-sigma factor RsiW